jgi:hypothetical protein
MQLINLTPHAVVIHVPDSIDVVIPPSGQQARVAVVAELAPSVILPDGRAIQCVWQMLGGVEGLPPRGASDVGYIVSQMALAACDGRDDVFAPDTSPASVIRDVAGNILAVQRLVAAARRG